MSPRSLKKKKNNAEKIKAYEAIELARDKHFASQLKLMTDFYSGTSDSSKIPVSVRFPAGLLADVDYLASIMGITRSELIVLAVYLFNGVGHQVKNSGDFSYELLKKGVI